MLRGKLCCSCIWETLGSIIKTDCLDYAWFLMDLKILFNTIDYLQSHNKVSLRNLSMVLRQLGDTRDEKQKNVLDGITKAKEAVNLDINDGTSWCKSCTLTDHDSWQNCVLCMFNLLICF